MKVFKQIIIVFFLFTLLKANGQIVRMSGLDTLAGHFMRSINSEHHEKILLHTDKWFYVAGEDVWFSAFCINTLSHKFSSYSKVVFADLVNDKDSIIAQLLLKNNSQKPKGKISLLPTLSEGYYWLRVYTRNILREDTNLICVQPIYIFNKETQSPNFLTNQINKEIKKLSDSDQPRLIFFPEGGSIISGINSNIAFRVVDKYNIPVEVSGFVTDGKDSVVAKFSTSMPGLGKFSFFVENSEKYTAHIHWKGNKELTFALPSLDPFSYQLSIIDHSNKYFHVQVSLGDSLYKKNKLSYVLGISRDSLCFAAVGHDMFDFTILKENFQPGKATLLLFDERGKIVSERNIHINRKEPLVNIITDKVKYGSREKVKLSIECTHSNKLAAISLMSLSVTDDSLAIEPIKIPDEAEIENDNIEYAPWLSLPDLIKQNYTEEQWDLLMLTQNNKYMNWQYRSNKYDSLGALPIEDSSLGSISGLVIDRKGKRGEKKVVTLFTYKTDMILKKDTIGENGRFHFQLPHLRDSTEFMLQVADLKGRTIDERIIMDTFPFPSFKTPIQLKKRLSEENRIILKNLRNQQLDNFSTSYHKNWLKPVTVVRAKEIKPNYDESKRVSQFSHIITFDQLQQWGMNSIENALLFVPGVHLRGGKIVIGGPTSFNSAEPLLVVDGAEYDFSRGDSIGGGGSAFEILGLISPSTIDFIEVLTGPEAAFYGSRGGNGVILINTRNKLRNIEQNGEGWKRFYSTGFTIAPDFHEPDYDNKDLKKSAFPDQRTTLFWNGNILSDEYGKATVHFFTSDATTTYTVWVKGVTVNGDIFSEKIKILRQ